MANQEIQNLEVSLRYYYKKNPDGTRTKVYYAPVTVEEAIFTQDGQKLSDHVNGKVDKVNGKGLSTNDYTNDDKSAVQNISQLSTNQGTLDNLTTTAKTNLVSAINEVNNKSIPTKTSQLQNDSNFLTSHQDISAKLQVKEVKSNGNIVLKDGNNNEKEYMAATPSGNPMHNVYIKAGAVWNSTTGYWEMNRLTNLTNDEMDVIFAKYNKPINAYSKGLYMYINNSARTNMPIAMGGYPLITNSCEFLCYMVDKIVSFNIGYIKLVNNSTQYIANCYNLKYVIGVLDISSISSFNFTSFSGLGNLVEINLFKLKTSVYLNSMAKLSNSSILYMLQNATNTTAITITLHATAYANAMADAEIVAAAEAKNISLASA